MFLERHRMFLFAASIIVFALLMVWAIGLILTANLLAAESETKSARRMYMVGLLILAVAGFVLSFGSANA